MVIPKTNLLVLSMLQFILAILATSFLALPVLAQGNELWPAEYVLVVTVNKVIAPQGQARLNGYACSALRTITGKDFAFDQQRWRKWCETSGLFKAEPRLDAPRRRHKEDGD